MDIDLLFLDIQIPNEMSGIEIAKEIRSKDEYTPIAFTTNYAEYAYEGYCVNAIRYLRSNTQLFINFSPNKYKVNRNWID